MSKPADLVQGTLDLLILKILAFEPLRGWVIGQRLKQVSGDVLQVSDGSLYPALHKLEQVDAVLIRPLPYVDAGRLVMIWDEMSYIGFPKHNSTPAEWREWRQNNTVFTDIAATQPVQAILSSDGEPEEATASPKKRRLEKSPRICGPSFSGPTISRPSPWPVSFSWRWRPWRVLFPRVARRMSIR